MTTYATKIHQMTIGQRLRWLLEVEGKSIKDLHDVSGIKYGTLQQYLSDKRTPGAAQLADLARAGIDLHWLLLGEQGNTLKLIFPGFEKLQGPLAADSELASVFLEEAMDAVDEFHEKWVTARGKPLPTVNIYLSVWSVFSLYDKLLDQISDNIIEARQKGLDNADIAEFILTSPVRDEVRKRLKLIESDLRNDEAASG